jgi:hypothetical protein
LLGGLVRRWKWHGKELFGLWYLCVRANGVIILNFIADALANLFLSGMFVRR